MSTPEGITKAIITKLLEKYDIKPAAKAGTFSTASGWYYFAVQGQMSVKGVPDIVGHYLGMFFAIEAKALGKKPTGFQALQIHSINVSGGAVFVVDGPESLKVFERWLTSVDNDSHYELSRMLRRG